MSPELQKWVQLIWTFVTVVIFCVCVYGYLREMDGVTGVSWPVLLKYMVIPACAVVFGSATMVLDGLLLELRDYDLNGWLMLAGFTFAGIFTVLAALTEKESLRSLLFNVASGSAGYAIGLNTSRKQKSPSP